MENVKQYPSSFNKNNDVEQIEFGQATIPIWAAMVFLIFSFFILKAFIYTPDESKKDK
jgi:hypothetical protein